MGNGGLAPSFAHVDTADDNGPFEPNLKHLKLVSIRNEVKSVGQLQFVVGFVVVAIGGVDKFELTFGFFVAFGTFFLDTFFNTFFFLLEFFW